MLQVHVNEVKQLESLSLRSGEMRYTACMLSTTPSLSRCILHETRTLFVNSPKYPSPAPAPLWPLPESVCIKRESR
jgi:hypothetical protein